MLALSISFFLYCAIFTLIAGLYQRLHQESANLNLILRPLYMASFVDPKLPPHYLNKIRDIPLLHAASPYKVYLGEGRAGQGTVFVIGVDPYEIPKLRRLGLKEGQSLEQFQRNKHGVLVGEIAMEQQGWRVGDRVILKGVRDHPSLSVSIMGVMKNEGDFGAAVLAHYEYIKNAFQGNGSMSIVLFRAKEAYQVPWLTSLAERTFDAAPVPVEIITEKAFLRSVFSELEGVVTAIQAIAWVTIAATICIVGNTLSIAIRERKREIGVFRTLGFSHWILLMLFLGEAVVLSGLGGFIGAGLAWLVFYFGKIRISAGVGSSEISILPQLEPVFQSIALALGVGLVASVIPSWRFANKPITENLSSVD